MLGAFDELSSRLSYPPRAPSHGSGCRHRRRRHVPPPAAAGPCHPASLQSRALWVQAAAELLEAECGSAQLPQQQALAALLNADLKQVRCGEEGLVCTCIGCLALPAGLVNWYAQVQSFGSCLCFGVMQV